MTRSTTTDPVGRIDSFNFTSSGVVGGKSFTPAEVDDQVRMLYLVQWPLALTQWSEEDLLKNSIGRGSLSNLALGRVNVLYHFQLQDVILW